MLWLGTRSEWLFFSGVASLIITGSITFPLTAEVWLALMGSFFVIPVAFLTGLFTFPLWLWFFIVLMWMSMMAESWKLYQHMVYEDDE